MLIGTAGPLPTAPKEKTVFIEDLPERERMKATKTTPAGLVNLGNTCYMNSTVQTLIAVPEFRQSLQRSFFFGLFHLIWSQFQSNSLPNQANAGDIDSALTVSLAQLSKSLSNSGDAVTPFAFLAALRRVWRFSCVLFKIANIFIFFLVIHYLGRRFHSLLKKASMALLNKMPKNVGLR